MRRLRRSWWSKRTIRVSCASPGHISSPTEYACAYRDYTPVRSLLAWMHVAVARLVPSQFQESQGKGPSLRHPRAERREPVNLDGVGTNDITWFESTPALPDPSSQTPLSVTLPHAEDLECRVNISIVRPTTFPRKRVSVTDLSGSDLHRSPTSATTPWRFRSSLAKRQQPLAVLPLVTTRLSATVEEHGADERQDNGRCKSEQETEPQIPRVVGNNAIVVLNILLVVVEFAD